MSPGSRLYIDLYYQSLSSAHFAFSREMLLCAQNCNPVSRYVPSHLVASTLKPMVCPLTVICASASRFLKYAFLGWVNGIILFLELSKATCFLSSCSTALIPTLVILSHSCSTQFASTSYSQSYANVVAMHPSTYFSTFLNTTLR